MEFNLAFISLCVLKEKLDFSGTMLIWHCKAKPSVRKDFLFTAVLAWDHAADDIE